MKKLQVILTSTLLIAPTMVFATGGKSIPCKNHKEQRSLSIMFDEIDENKNGKVTLKEFKQFALERSKYEKRFQRIDSDNDGIISKNELTQHKSNRQKRNHNH